MLVTAPCRLGDSLAVELPALTRAALVRIQVPQPHRHGAVPEFRCVIEGVVNRASRFRVQGWAADSDEPDGVVEVVIKVNGTAVARIKADEPSEGLKKLGKYGEGRHVFTFGFNPPLPSEHAQTIVVSAVGAKDPLRQGTAKLAPVPLDEMR